MLLCVSLSFSLFLPQMLSAVEDIPKVPYI